MSRLVLSGFASLAVILSSNPYRAPDVATGRPARSDVVIENAVTVSSDPSLVDYPRAFINPTTGSVAVDDPYCKIERDRIAYPRTFLGDLPFPSVSGSPLPAAITRVVGLKDIWGCCLTNPGLNHECGGGDMHQAYVATLNRVMQLRGEQIGITNWVWITDAQIPLLDLDRPELTEPELAFIVGQARQRNLSVMLYLNIPSADLRGNALPRAPSREWYLNYLNSYAEFVERQAVLAERYGIATMML
ncbi:MAG: hypothetical protein NTY02_18890, partial [Acidobacteria bacterium]|nr:hypothetical protein [Acidobacteriota bacterium]